METTTQATGGELNASNSVHVFERAGLGKAPFRVIGIVEEPAIKRFTTPEGLTCETKGGGTCDFCGTYIRTICTIKSADGRRFKVGCDCVLKAGDKGLRRVVDAHKARARREALQAKGAAADAIIADVLATKADALRALPHPKGFTDRNTGEPLTAFDWLSYMARGVGATGAQRLVKDLRAMGLA